VTEPGDPIDQPETIVEETITVQSTLFEAEFSNRGALITSWELMTYATPDGDPVQIVNGTGEVGMVLETERGVVNLDNLMYTVRREREGGGGQRIIFETATDDGMRIAKTYTIPADGYLIDLGIDISGAAFSTNYRVVWARSLPPAEGDHKKFRSGEGALVLVGNDLEVIKPKAFKREREKTIEGNVRWTAVRDKYFIAAMLPPENISSRVVAHGSNDIENTGVQLVMPLLRGAARHDIQMYLGPMEYERMKAVGSKFELGVDLGWKIFLPVSQLLLWLMVWIYGFIPNYGVVIILVAGISKLVFYPLTRTSVRSMKAMQAIQPQVQELKEKYKSDSKLMNQKMMELYKTNKVNPLGGCLPILLQMPVFIALYSVLSTSITMRQAPFMLWINDLSAPDVIGSIGSFVIHILPVVMFLSSIAQQMVTPMTDSRQKMMGYTMPLVMLFIFYSFPAGLNLYWTVNNILQVAQQWSIHKEPTKMPVTEAKT